MPTQFTERVAVAPDDLTILSALPAATIEP
jgi:hypothetical protein